jgi:hypothetical protein
MRAAQRVLIRTKYSGDDDDCERPHISCEHFH